jgi:hypothetical protein
MIFLSFSLPGFVSSWEKKMMKRRSDYRIHKWMTTIR